MVHTVRSQASPCWAILIGLLFGAVINIRPIYQASLLVVFILALIGWSRSGWKNLIVRSVLSLIGIALVLLPQLWINRWSHRSAGACCAGDSNRDRGQILFTVIHPGIWDGLL